MGDKKRSAGFHFRSVVIAAKEALSLHDFVRISTGRQIRISLTSNDYDALTSIADTLFADAAHEQRPVKLRIFIEPYHGIHRLKAIVSGTEHQIEYDPTEWAFLEPA